VFNFFQAISTQEQELTGTHPPAEGQARRGLFSEPTELTENDMLWGADDVVPLDCIPEERECVVQVWLQKHCI